MKASDGIDTTKLESQVFDIENADGSKTNTDGPQLTPGFEFLLAVITLSLSLIWYRKKR